MRTLRLLPLAACLAAATFALPAGAQIPAENVAPPPPKMEILKEDDQPAITITKPGTESEITEQREQGRLKEVKVKTGGSTYYLKPKGAAAAPPDDAHGGNISVPMWVIKEFGGPEPKAEKDADNGDASQPKPAPKK